MQSFVFAIAMLAVFALFVGGVRLVVKEREPKRGLLMIVAAAVLLGNVLMWTWPV